MSETDPQATGDPHDPDSSPTGSLISHDPSSPTLPVRHISDYQLIRKIGRGGMGEVYEALHERLKKRVAVKLLPDGRSSESGVMRRFFREMEAAGKLTHPHIIQATDAGEVDGMPYLVMELVDGADLGHIVRQFGALPPLAALEAVEQAAMGLEHIHHHGLVHRDVKPSNLLMDRQGVVKVGDLGLAQLSHPPSQSDDLTSSDLLMGTIDYMAPEQAESPKLVDHRADIYSLGCCLYNLMTGKSVFNSASRIERLLAHRSQVPPLLSQNCQYLVPESVERLFHRMLEKGPSQRPTSMGEILRDIAECRKELQKQFAKLGSTDVEIGPQRFSSTSSLREVASNVFAGPIRAPQFYAKSTVIGNPLPRCRSGRSWKLPAIALTLVLGGLAIWYLPHLRTTTSQIPPKGTELQSLIPVVPADHGDQQPTNSGTNEIRSAHNGAVYALEFSPDGKVLLSAGDDGFAKAWDLASGRPLTELRDSKAEIMISIAALPNDSLAVVGSYSGRAYVWNWKTGSTERTFDQAVWHVESVAAAGGTKVASAGVDDVIYLWDALTGSVVSRFPNTHQGGVRALAADPGHRYLVSGDYEGNLLLWDLAKEVPISQLRIGQQRIAVWGLDWSPDGKQIAIAGIGKSEDGRDAKGLLVVYDPFRQEVVRAFPAHGKKNNSVRFSRDGTQLFSAGEDFRIWSLPDGELLHKQNLSGGELFGMAVGGKEVAVGTALGSIHFVPVVDSNGSP